MKNLDSGKFSNIKYSMHLKLTFCGGMLVGLIIFIYLYGLEVVNPLNDTWIYTRASDFSQAYNGWLLYRETPWTFPLGFIDGMFYQMNSVTTISTDSIPIFALFFKILSPILPETFQYFGIWELLCFCLQGGLGALLLRKKISYTSVAVLGSPFFVIASWFISRVFQHCALSGQFIVLAAWCMWAYRKEESIAKKILKWGAICSVAILITPYFAIMTGGLMMGYTLQNFFQNKKKQEILVPVGTVVITAFAFAIMGGFFGLNSGINNHILGESSINLNTWFNSQGTSIFLPALPTGGVAFPNEGFQYLGVGIILLIPFGLIYIISWTRKFVKFSQIEKRNQILRFAPLFIICICFSFFSAFPYIRLGDKEILAINLPDKLYNIFDIFQSNGRFFWVMSYGVTAFLIISYVRFWEHFKVTKKIIPLLMIPVIALQWIDRPMYWYGFSEYKQANLVTEDKTILPQSAIWDEVFSQVEYLDFLWGWDVAGTQAFVPKAAQYGVKLNVSQAARQSLQSVAEYAMETTGNLASGIVPENKAYILQNINYILTSLIPQEKLRFFHEDGYYLVIPDDLRISGNYEEIKEETSTISEYGSFLRTLDENHIVCMASYGISEISDVTFVREFLEAAGIELEEELDNNELAMAFEPVNHDLMYSIDPENAVLALENGDQIGNVVLPGQITIAGKSDINLDQSNELGVTICGQHIMLPLYGGIMVYVYNVNTGVVENIAWTTADNTMFNVIGNYNFSLPQEE